MFFIMRAHYVWFGVLYITKNIMKNICFSPDVSPVESYVAFISIANVQCVLRFISLMGGVGGAFLFINSTTV